ncbi:MAG: hypothetical protein ACJ74Q_15865 [Pyrinomonadaceae bacterium]
MKQAKSLTAAFFLSLLFASSAFGGDIYCGVIGTTGDPAPATTSASATLQETNTTGGQQEPEASPASVIVEAALDVLQGVLAVL